MSALESPATLSAPGAAWCLMAAAMLAVAGTPAAAAADVAVGPLAVGERVVFLGDSITQAGDKPGGYVALVREAIARTLPDAGIDVIGAGISGNKVPDLESRLDRDVLAKNPTTVVIYIGINDVWHSQQGKGTPKPAFEKGLRSLVGRIRAAGARVILCTPSVIGEQAQGQNPLDAMLDEYSDITRSVAADLATGLLDLRKACIAHLAAANASGAGQGRLTTDGVHLNEAGNRFVAGQMLEALGVTASAGGTRKLRHVVLFKFKDTSTPEDVARIVAAFQGLSAEITEIDGFEWGTDVSPEGKSQGFTHCFIVTFDTAADRDAYLPHPAHQAFVSLVGPHVDKVCVVDFWGTK